MVDVTTAQATIAPTPTRTAPKNRRGSSSNILLSIAARLLVDVILLICRAACALFRRKNKPKAGDPRVLLLTGTFYNSGWYRSHFNPLWRCTELEKIVVVSDEPLEPFPKIVYECPPKWLQRVVSRPLARLIWTWRATGKHRAGMLMGYHIMPNSLICLFVAALRNRQAIYQMTGGPTQIIGGGNNGENSILRRLGKPSARRERWMSRAAQSFDSIIVRGDRAREYVHDNALSDACFIIPGGADVQAFADAPPLAAREYDLIIVGRLVPVKRVDRAIRIFASVVQRKPDASLLIVGDGPLRADLESLASTLGVRRQICFLGQSHDVESQLIRARAFLLTSEIEGLSIAMIEAMAAGLPAFVPRIGDLEYLLRDDETGRFIDPDDPESAANQIANVFRDPGTLPRLCGNAQKTAFDLCDYSSIADEWNKIFRKLRARATTSTREPRTFALSRKNLWEKSPFWLKRVVGFVMSPIPARFVLGARFRTGHRFATSSNRWSKQQVVAHQLGEIRKICGLAASQSPYYREVFSRVGFNPQSIRRPEDLEVLPLIEKSTIRECLDDMQTVPSTRWDVDVVSTGGSSGQPLTFYIGAERSAIEYAHLVSLWERGGYRLGMPTAVFRGEVVGQNRNGLHYKHDPILRRHYFSNFYMSDEDMRGYLEVVSKLDRCALLVYPSSAYALSRFVHQGGHEKLKNVDVVLAGSEMTYPGQRELAEAAFNARYYTWYGHSEKLVLAGECAHSTDYHVEPSYGYCELIDDNGNPISEPGQRGEIVGTGFMNRVVPFIRYRTGDWATFVGNRCEKCGRETLIFRDVEGHRTQEQLVLASGDAVSWVSLNMHDDTFHNVRQFQFFQDTPGRCILKIVVEPGFHDQDAARILRNLDRKLDGRMEVTINRVEEIPLTRNGKTIYVDQKIRTNHAAPKEGMSS